jgi:hypothetical protein
MATKSKTVVKRYQRFVEPTTQQLNFIRECRKIEERAEVLTRPPVSRNPITLDVSL